jgi:putative Mg2+ transporter-C (MgtC) family protein
MGPSELELIGRVALAAACGAAIGFERELVEKPAGLRTHALVALGAAAFTVAGYGGLSSVATGVQTDVSRIAAQVVTGVGFLGAGVVIFHGDRLRGLTTAAELWAVAGIGVLSGLGLIYMSTAATAMILIIVVGGRPVERVVDRVRRRRRRREREEAQLAGDPDDPRASQDDEDDDVEAQMRPGGGVAA